MSPQWKRLGFIVLKYLFFSGGVLSLILIIAVSCFLLYTYDYVKECEARGLAPFEVKPADVSSGDGWISVTPAGYKGGMGFARPSIDMSEKSRANPLLARLLLSYPGPEVRISTACQLLESDAPLHPDIVKRLKQIVLQDRNIIVRRAVLYAFHDPFEYKEPHLDLNTQELSELLSDGDVVCFQVLADLVGNGTCRLQYRGQAELKVCCQPFLEKLGSHNPADCTLSYEALVKILNRPNLAEEIIQPHYPNERYFSGAAFQFWFSEKKTDQDKARKFIETIVNKG
ncbi:MAG: hypothetical protein HY774_18970 [Acidobacteria bacterium]|nr:hypothetical protein [Acidobacteriota bacterium]